MATNTESRNLIPWRKRAGFRLGRTRKARQQQFKRQTQMLTLVLSVAIVGAGIVALINYNGAGAAKEVSCADYPEYCVPLSGGSASYAELEASDTRDLDAPSEGVEGVVRFVDAETNTPFLGNPDALIDFVVVSDYACGHCQDYHRGEMKSVVNDFVLTGQATVGHVQYTGIGGTYSQTASMAAYCAGEQGAYWEMADELFRLGNSMGVANAFEQGQIRDSADDMGLDADELISCVNSGKYASALSGNTLFASDNGVSSTPTVLYRIGDGDWVRAPSRAYSAIETLVEAAQRAP